MLRRREPDEHALRLPLGGRLPRPATLPPLTLGVGHRCPAPPLRVWSARRPKRRARSFRGQGLGGAGLARSEKPTAKAIHDGLEQGDHVTSDQFRAGLAEVRAEIANLDTRLSTQIAELRTEQRTGIANLETRLVRWMVGTVIATATLTVGILLLIG